MAKKIEMSAAMKAAVDLFCYVIDRRQEAKYEREKSPLMPPKLVQEEGLRYVRIWTRCEADTRNGFRGSAYCFVDKETGDLLKPATWKAPAKHARGNVLRCEYLGTAGPYGMAYLTRGYNYSFPGSTGTATTERPKILVALDAMIEGRTEDAYKLVAEVVAEENAVADQINNRRVSA